MGWRRLVGSSKLKVSFAKEPYKREDTLQKRTMISSSLPIVATPYLELPFWPPFSRERLYLTYSICLLHPLRVHTYVPVTNIIYTSHELCPLSITYYICLVHPLCVHTFVSVTNSIFYTSHELCPLNITYYICVVHPLRVHTYVSANTSII